MFPFPSSSNEEDNDKENIDPDPHRPIELCSSPKGDPVKAFVDDEAEEEDDSDNDLIRFQENEEDEDNGGSEELNDLIATEYEENPIDGEKRNQLHQQWLAQQDAAGTDNLLQRLKCGPEQRETAMLGGEDDDDEEEDNEEEEEFCDEALEGLGGANLVRMNSRKIKQMIPQMFTDKDDGFLSSDDEETEKMLVKQRLLEKAVSFYLSKYDSQSYGLFCFLLWQKYYLLVVILLVHSFSWHYLLSICFNFLFTSWGLNIMIWNRKSRLHYCPQKRMKIPEKFLVL